MSQSYTPLFPELQAEFNTVAQKLLDASSVAVIAHINPDADAVGSACALVAGLRQRGITVNAYIGQMYPHTDNVASVPFVDEITYTDVFPNEELVVTVDAASADRTGAFSAAIVSSPDKVVVIDHHATNPGFGGINLITEAESTTVIIRELFDYLGVSLDTDIAHCLYAGLVTDTGSFRWGSPRMHLLAAELMDYGLDTRAIAMALMDEMPAGDLRHLGSVLASMETVEAAGLTVSVFTIDDMSRKGMTQTAVEAIVDYARSISGSDVGVVLKQYEGIFWNISLRSSLIDVSAVAARLGGGGHVAAAGYSARGSRQEVIDALIGALP